MDFRVYIFILAKTHTVSHLVENPNLLSLIGGKHLLDVLEVKNLESSQVIDVIPDGAVDHILKRVKGHKGLIKKNFYIIILSFAVKKS